MADKIEVTGIEIKINGKKVMLSVEDAWGLKRELDKLLHTESVPYPYPWPVSPFTPYIPYVPYTTDTRPYWSDTASSGGFNCETIDGKTIELINLM